MPGFTSVTSQQPYVLHSQAPSVLEQEQMGGSLGAKLASEITQSLAQGAKAAKRAGRVASTAAVKAKAKYVPLGSKMDDLEPLVEGAKKSSTGGVGVSKTEKLVNKGLHAAVRAGNKLKNKNLNEIAENALSSGKAIKKVSQEIAKRGGKKVLAAAATGGVTAGIGVAIDYLKHVGEGKEPLSGSDLKKLVVDAGVGVAKKGLEGKLSNRGVQREILDSYNRIISTKKGGKAAPKSVNLVKTLGGLQKLLQRLNKTHWRRHYKVNGEEPLGLLEGRVFGSGVMARHSHGKTRSRKGCRSRRGRCGKRKKTARKGRRRRGGRCRGAKLMKRVHDVFDVY